MMPEELEEIIRKQGEKTREAIEESQQSIIRAIRSMRPEEERVQEEKRRRTRKVLRQSGDVRLVRTGRRNYIVYTPRREPYGPYKTLKTAVKHYEREKERVG